MLSTAGLFGDLSNWMVLNKQKQTPLQMNCILPSVDNSEETLWEGRTFSSLLFFFPAKMAIFGMCRAASFPRWQRPLSLSLLEHTRQQTRQALPAQSMLLTCSWTCTGGAGNRFFSWKNSKNEASREENPSSVTVWTSKEGKEIEDRSL